jgi:hypothetical protein
MADWETKEYPFRMPNKVTTHVPISFGITLLDETNNEG